jgi:hypothetical protein
VGCSATTVSKVEANAYASFALVNTDDVNWASAVEDWTAYGSIDMLIYSTSTVSFKADVDFKGGYNNEGTWVNVEGTTSGMETKELLPNLWHKLRIDLTGKILNKADGSISYTSIGDENLNTNAIQLFLNSEAATIYIGGIVLTEKSTTPPSSISLAPGSITLIPGKSFILAPTIMPSDAVKSLDYSSSSSSATAENGMVTSKAAGTAEIKASSTMDASVFGMSTVTVVKPSAADNKMWANYEGVNPPFETWGTMKATVVPNPSKSGSNTSDSCLKISDATQWDGLKIGSVEVNKINRLTWLIYSETALSGLIIRCAYDNFRLDKEMTIDLPEKTWMQMEWLVNLQAVGETSGTQVYLQLASAHTGSTYYIDQIRQHVDGETPVGNIKAEQVAVSPNPASNTLSINTLKNIAGIEIYSMAGEKLKESKNSATINVAELAQGLYLVQARAKDGALLVSKFIKE